MQEVNQGTAIPLGLCGCGCGEKTTIALRSRTRTRSIKGQPNHFMKGHRVSKDLQKVRYRHISVSVHSAFPRTGHTMGAHIAIAERALGKRLPFGAEVHHVNGKRGDNDPHNLIICNSSSYHFLLHVRTRALHACGNANWRKCQYCKVWDDPKIMYQRGKTNGFYHQKCFITYQRNRKANKQQQPTPPEAPSSRGQAVAA